MESCPFDSCFRMLGIEYKTEVRVLNKHKGPFALLILCGGKQDQESKLAIFKLIYLSTLRWKKVQCNTKSATLPRLSQFCSPLCITYFRKLSFFYKISRTFKRGKQNIWTDNSERKQRPHRFNSAIMN